MPDGVMRCHFSSIIYNAFKTLWAFIAIIVFNIADSVGDIMSGDVSSNTVYLSTAGMVGLLLVFFLLFFLQWRKTYIYIENDSFVVEKKFMIQRKKTTVKLSSIATVNLQQGIFERIFNTYRLQIDINSSVTADKTDFNLVFSKDTALKLKNFLTANTDIRSENNEAAEIMESPITPVFEFSIGRVVKHCLLSISVFGIIFSGAIIAFGLYETYQSSGGGNPTSLVKYIVFSLVPVLYQSLTPFFRYQNFTIGKQGKKVIISYGFITTRQFTLPIDKTNAIVIKQPFWARIFKLYYGEIINVGMGEDEKNSAPIFCLCVNRDELNYILGEITPDFILTDDTAHSPRSAFAPTFLGFAFWGLFLLIPLIVLGYWWAGVIIYVFLMLCAFASYKTKGLNLQEDKAGITTGIFLKRTVIVPYGKIQNMKTSQGPVSRRLGLFKGQVCILSDVMNRINAIGYFPEESFEKIADKMLAYDSVNYLKPVKGESS